MAQDQRFLRSPRLLDWLMPCFRKRRGYQRIPPAPNLLAVLPDELILSIADFIQPNDVLCFSLCDHRIFSLLRERQAPRLGRSATLELLQRLERDLPHHFVCYRCITLHHCYRASDLNTMSWSCSEYQLPCIANFARGSLIFILKIHQASSHTNYDFTFLHLQLVMKRFSCGLRYGNTPEKLSHIQVRESLDPRCTTLFSIEAKVCTSPLGLYLRIQDIVLFKYQVEDFFDYPNIYDDGRPPHVFMICAHLPFFEMKKLINPFLPAYKQVPSPIRLEGTCEKCNTDFLLQLQEFDGHSAFIVTRWMNLGRGLTPEDPLWTIQSLQSRSASDLRWHRLGPELEDMNWSPRRSYESASGDWVQETLLSRNLSSLKGKRYRRWFYSSGVSSWELRCPEIRWAQAHNRKIH
ncbi:unnamed protein product [Penicillium salamii]|uniref:F-box domain-containing protein n=1 Tax=Penicillium salamii TaxID=1612424 RepID=A0A9W4JIM1_9EURO|nr:unnamed protein product [Penicillium salamii]